MTRRQTNRRFFFTPLRLNRPPPFACLHWRMSFWQFNTPQLLTLAAAEPVQFRPMPNETQIASAWTMFRLRMSSPVSPWRPGNDWLALWALSPWAVSSWPMSSQATAVAISQSPPAESDWAYFFVFSFRICKHSTADGVSVPWESPEIEIIWEITNKFLLFTVQYTEDIFSSFFFLNNWKYLWRKILFFHSWNHLQAWLDQLWLLLSGYSGNRWCCRSNKVFVLT